MLRKVRQNRGWVPTACGSHPSGALEAKGESTGGDRSGCRMEMDGGVRKGTVSEDRWAHLVILCDAGSGAALPLPCFLLPLRVSHTKRQSRRFAFLLSSPLGRPFPSRSRRRAAGRRQPRPHLIFVTADPSTSLFFFLL